MKAWLLFFPPGRKSFCLRVQAGWGRVRGMCPQPLGVEAATSGFVVALGPPELPPAPPPWSPPQGQSHRRVVTELPGTRGEHNSMRSVVINDAMINDGNELITPCGSPISAVEPKEAPTGPCGATPHLWALFQPCPTNSVPLTRGLPMGPSHLHAPGWVPRAHPAR